MADPPEVRASDAERDAVVAALEDATVAGRLAPAELEDRTDAALHARTHGELAALVADLPEPTGGDRLAALADELVREAARLRLSRASLAAFLLSRS